MKTMEREFRKRQLTLMRKHFGEARIQQSPLFIPGEFPQSESFRFDFERLSKNPNVTVEFFTAHADENWDYNALSHNKACFAIAKAFPEKPWIIRDMFGIQEPDWDFIRAHLDQAPAKNRSDSWYFNEDADVPEDIIIRSMSSNKMEVSGIVSEKHLLERPNYPWRSDMISYNSRISWKFFTENLWFDWVLQDLKDRCFPLGRDGKGPLHRWNLDKAPFDMILQNETIVPLPCEILERPDLTPEILRKLMAKGNCPTEMYCLSRNRAFSYEMMLEHTSSMDFRNPMDIACARWCASMHATLRTLGELCMRSQLSFDVAREIFSFL